METLARSAGVVLSRERLLELVWGYDFATDSNLVDVYVRYLRQRIDRPGQPSLVATVRGLGYRFDAPVDAPT